MMEWRQKGTECSTDLPFAACGEGVGAPSAACRLRLLLLGLRKMLPRRHSGLESAIEHRSPRNMTV